MARIPTGVLSTTIGKVAGVVGQNWKGINYIREYVKTPNNPSPAQLASRAIYRETARFARFILQSQIAQLPLNAPAQNTLYNELWRLNRNAFADGSSIETLSPSPNYSPVAQTRDPRLFLPTDFPRKGDIYFWLGLAGQDAEIGVLNGTAFASSDKMVVGIWDISNLKRQPVIYQSNNVENSGITTPSWVTALGQRALGFVVCGQRTINEPNFKGFTSVTGYGFSIGVARDHS